MRVPFAHASRSLTALVMVAAVTSLAVAQAAPATPQTPATPTSASAASAPAAPAAPAKPTYVLQTHAEALKLGRIVFERAMAGNIDALVESADPAMGAPDALREKLKAGIADMSTQLGPEVAMTTERIMLVNGSVQYWRTSTYTEVPVPLIFRVVMGPVGKWRGFTASSTDQAPAGTEMLP
jgi:hypothetical protein